MHLRSYHEKKRSAILSTYVHDNSIYVVCAIITLMNLNKQALNKLVINMIEKHLS